MKKNKLKFAWSIAEKVICYVALSVVVITQIISLIFPDFSGLDNEVTFGIFGAALILIFQNVNDTKQQISKKSNVLFSQNFNEGLVSIWNKKQKIDTLDILCQTSNTYYHSIANQNITIDTLRILINKPKSNNTKHYPAQEVMEHFDGIRDQTIELWKALQKKGKIKNLEIRYYEFDPTIHFAITKNTCTTGCISRSTTSRATLFIRFILLTLKNVCLISRNSKICRTFLSISAVIGAILTRKWLPRPRLECNLGNNKLLCASKL